MEPKKKGRHYATCDYTPPEVQTMIPRILFHPNTADIITLIILLMLLAITSCDPALLAVTP